MPYTQLTQVDRYCIYHQKMAGLSDAEVGRRLGRHRGNIGRELQRFKAHPSWAYCEQYFPEGAQQLARERRGKPRGSYWARHRPLLAYVLRALRDEWSPEQVAGRLVKDRELTLEAQRPRRPRLPRPQPRRGAADAVPPR